MLKRGKASYSRTRPDVRPPVCCETTDGLSQERSSQQGLIGKGIIRWHFLKHLPMLTHVDVLPTITQTRAWDQSLPVGSSPCCQEFLSGLPLPIFDLISPNLQKKKKNLFCDNQIVQKIKCVFSRFDETIAEDLASGCKCYFPLRNVSF